jgi:hypothetical protein
MEITSELEAKQIIKDGLESWVGTFTEFRKIAKSMVLNAKGVDSIEKREVAVNSYLRKEKPRIYVKKVPFGLSNEFLIEVESVIQPSHSGKMSKAQNQKAASNQQKIAQHTYKLSQKTTYVFVVKNDVDRKASELMLVIFSTGGNNKFDLFESHVAAVVKKHCLERLVQRLNLKKIEQAIEEILPSIKWLEGSGHELAGRSPGSYGEEGIKRHVPTPNGAFLLITNDKRGVGYQPEQDCYLKTWIHKRQFKKNQEVTTREFKYAMTVNRYLCDLDLPSYILTLRKVLEDAHNERANQTVFVRLHGERYLAADLLESLERKEFLDCSIDFERDVRNR